MFNYLKVEAHKRGSRDATWWGCDENMDTNWESERDIQDYKMRKNNGNLVGTSLLKHVAEAAHERHFLGC